MKTCLSLVIMLLFAISAFGATYSWVDDQGTMNFTEDYGKIPKKYRMKARVLGEEEPDQPPSPAPMNEKSLPKSNVTPEATVQPPTENQQQKKVEYGDKEASVWKNEFGKLNADLKAAEDQLVDLRGQVKDTSKMSRSEYLSIQATIRKVENRVLELRKNRDDLTRAANRANVPDEYR